ncbi:hypothetical protein BH11ACT6_BH11ACT6_52620 [soil metagenome]
MIEMLQVIILISIPAALLYAVRLAVQRQNRLDVQVPHLSQTSDARMPATRTVPPPP